MPTWGYGAAAARLTPDQKVGSSNLSGLRCSAASGDVRSAAELIDIWAQRRDAARLCGSGLISEPTARRTYTCWRRRGGAPPGPALPGASVDS